MINDNSNNNFIDFPNYDEYKSNLKILDQFDFKDYSPADIYKKYFELAKTIPLCNRIFSKEEFNKNIFFRARLNLDDTKEDISLISTYSFPPSIFCKENGRANLEKKPVFYCSDNLNSAIAECKPKHGDEGLLSIWKVDAKRDIKCGICLSRDLNEINKWSEIASRSYENFLNFPIEKSKFNQLNALHNFMNFKYKYEPSPYYLTSIISNEILYGEVHHDFLVYSSFIDDRYCNMAFHPNSVLENLRLEKVLTFKVNIVKDKIFLNLGKVGHVESSRIVWKNRTEEEEKLFLK